ncbi:MAG: 3-methylornithine--L-lysine ligase PylC [Methanomassiliicoccaceae archaeon]|jgi:pyrrolysine biosynthesis protein PylC|nr:3-methylornithine--L-lysine ligase PylC [Methanomassiliicoccaceae archaeon]
MKLGILGGALQGTEAVYLAKKAGYETFVIDRRKNAPALSLADGHAVLDPMEQEREAMRIFSDCDAVMPACENLDVLLKLNDMLKGSDIQLLFDMSSYLVSSSKTASNRMMEHIGVPIPKNWPECGYPAIVKPSGQSGSVGVTLAYSEKDVRDGIEKIIGMGDEPVMQEFVSGKSVSIEIIGNGKEFKPFVTTEIILDKKYDCKRVLCAPGILNKEKDEEFKAISEKMAEHMELKALMDVEAIDTVRGLRVLEIDARIPSQTPAAVLAATGINLLEETVSFTGRKATNGAASYEHFVITGGELITCGEKEFARVSQPRFVRGLFGSDEMITDYEPGAGTWRCTMINGASSEKELEKKRARCIASIMSECKLKKFVDESPEMI